MRRHDSHDFPSGLVSKVGSLTFPHFPQSAFGAFAREKKRMAWDERMRNHVAVTSGPYAVPGIGVKS
jgi:hypothetical protein